MLKCCRDSSVRGKKEKSNCEADQLFKVGHLHSFTPHISDTIIEFIYTTQYLLPPPNNIRDYRSHEEPVFS